MLFKVFDTESDCLLTKVFKEGNHQISKEFQLLLAKVDDWSQF